jgi:glycine/D-amino acid oxidase-like deaminating enzyme
VGFGASGRNGGWASGFIAGNPRVYAERSGDAAVLRAEHASFDAIGEIGRVAHDEGIECGFIHDGTITVAYSAPQRERLLAGLAAKHRRGISDSDIRRLTPDELTHFVRTPHSTAATFSPHCARIDPARLVRGLADACERRGVTIHEGTAAVVQHSKARTLHGAVTASTIVRATESYSVQADGWARRFLPLYSLMIATEPLGQEVWDELGWREGLTIGDAHHLFFYAQRTTDGRIAIGGRGAPYRLGSPIDQAQEHNNAVRERLIGSIARHFPAAATAAITHHWGGSLAVPRDWCMSVTYDPAAGVAFAGGYSGHGVVAANLGGRTLADLILRRESDLVTMPWVGHRPRNWEPEPLRYLASKAIVSVLGSADRHEDATGRRARRTKLVAPFVMSR